MTQNEFDGWTQPCIERFVDSLVIASGIPRETALEQAARTFKELLPRGVSTRGMSLWIVVDPHGMDVGSLWLGAHPARPGVLWVWDVFIEEASRGGGLGRAAMSAAEDVCRNAGLGEIALNVFGFNEPARSLYESLGYRAVQIEMSKDISTA